MDRKIKELIAVGASVTANCVACFRFHFKKAREAGAEDKEIQAAIGVGRAVRKGAADTWDTEAARFVLDLENDILPGCVITHAGAVINETIKNIVEGSS